VGEAEVEEAVLEEVSIGGTILIVRVFSPRIWIFWNALREKDLVLSVAVAVVVVEVGLAEVEGVSSAETIVRTLAEIPVAFSGTEAASKWIAESEVSTFKTI
jgi:hypothetical protein